MVSMPSFSMLCEKRYRIESLIEGVASSCAVTPSWCFPRLSGAILLCCASYLTVIKARNSLLLHLLPVVCFFSLHAGVEWPWSFASVYCACALRDLVLDKVRLLSEGCRPELEVVYCVIRLRHRASNKACPVAVVVLSRGPSGAPGQGPVCSANSM